MSADTKCDEWVSLPSEEELLDEVNELKTDLNACNQRIRDLEARNIALETERTSCLDELILSKTTLNDTRGKYEDCVQEKDLIEKELHSLQGTSEAQLVSMEESLISNRDQLDESRDTIKKLERELKIVQQRCLKETTDARMTAKDLLELKSKFQEMQTISKLQEVTITKSAKELREAMCELETMRKENLKIKKILNEKDMDLKLANSRLGTVAVLAEDRKDKGVSLDRTVAKHKHALAAANNEKENLKARVSSLEKEISMLRVASEAKVCDLQASLAGLEKVLEDTVEKDNALKMKDRELQVAKGEVSKVEASNKDLKSNLSVLEEELKESYIVEEKLRKEMEALKISHRRTLDNIRESLGEDDPFEFIISPFLSLFSVKMTPPKFFKVKFRQ